MKAPVIYKNILLQKGTFLMARILMHLALRFFIHVTKAWIQLLDPSGVDPSNQLLASSAASELREGPPPQSSPSCGLAQCRLKVTMLCTEIQREGILAKRSKRDNI